MGIFANGPRPDIVDIPGIAEGMRPAVEMWMTGRLRFYDPKRETASPYVPLGDSGGKATPLLLLDTGENGALIQPIRSPSRVDVGGQANGLLGIRFQVKHDINNLPVEPLRGGVLVQVADGGNALIPATWRFGLAEAIDSSLMWDRIFDAALITGG